MIIICMYVSLLQSLILVIVGHCHNHGDDIKLASADSPAAAPMMMLLALMLMMHLIH